MGQTRRNVLTDGRELTFYPSLMKTKTSIFIIVSRARKRAAAARRGKFNILSDDMPLSHEMWNTCMIISLLETISSFRIICHAFIPFSSGKRLFEVGVKIALEVKEALQLRWEGRK